ncbi:MAG: hypothetical protein L6R00_14880 [Phycisphaerae bacterium]|nr:hypothetical protein [Phycisphaerae bacterium]
MDHAVRVLISLSFLIGAVALARQSSPQAPPAPPVASAPADELLDLARFIPADSVAVYFGRPLKGDVRATSSAAVASGPSVSRFIGALGASGLLGGEGQLYADVVGALPLLGEFPHAVTLIDVEVGRGDADDLTNEPSDPDDRAAERVQLQRLAAAVILRTAGRNEEVLAQLNRLAARYTNQQDARISQRRLDGDSYNHLADRRLPEWCALTWGRVDDGYVIAFGEGAFESVLAARRGRVRRLGDDEWFVRAHERTAGRRALAEWHIHFARLRERLEAVTQRRLYAVLDALDARTFERDLWTLSLEGRAMACRRVFRAEGIDRMRAYSEPAAFPAEHRRRIPPEARRFAIIEGPTRWLLKNVPSAWIAGRHYRHVREIEAWWRRLQAECGIDVERQLLSHLGAQVIVCDYPPHPLGIPFALTIAVAIDQPDEVRGALDAILTVWSRRLETENQKAIVEALKLRAVRDADGVWYLQAGILGPALCVTRHYLVISWSPQALREALPFFRDE